MTTQPNGYVIPAYAGMTTKGGRFPLSRSGRGPGTERRGATRPVSGAYRRRLDSGLRRNDGKGGWNDDAWARAGDGRSGVGYGKLTG